MTTTGVKTVEIANNEAVKDRWIAQFRTYLDSPGAQPYFDRLKGGSLDFKHRDVLGLMVPWTSNLSPKYMSPPAKLFALLTAAIIFLQIGLRIWAVQSLKAENAQLEDLTGFWVQTTLTVLAALLVLAVTVVAVNTLYHGGKRGMAWVIAILPVACLIAMIMFSSNIVQVIVDMLTGKDLATALGDAFPNLLDVIHTWINGPDETDINVEETIDGVVNNQDQQNPLTCISYQNE